MGNWIVRELVYPLLGGKTTGSNHFSGMEEAFLRFPHLPEQIMEELDYESLTNSRLVAKSWNQFIVERKHRWIANLKKKCKYGQLQI